MPSISLRSKLFIGMSVSVLLLGIVMILLIQTALPGRIETQLNKRGMSIAEDIAHESIDLILQEKIIDLNLRLFEHKELDKDFEYIFILDKNGNVIAHTFDNNFPAELKEANIPPPDKKYNIQRITTEKGNIIDIAAPILRGELGVVRIGLLEAPIQKDIADITRMVVWIIIAVLVLGGGVMLFVARALTGPIHELIKGAEAVGSGDLKHRVRVGTNDDIGKLSASFNRMVESLGHAKDELISANTDLEEEISVRIKAEKELQKSEEKYRRIIENLRTDYFFYSYDANGVFTYLSPSIHNVLGYTPDEFLTHYTEYLTDNPINREVERHTELSIKGVQQEPYEIEIYHRNGGIRWLNVTEVPVLNDAGKVVAVEGIARDITAGKIADEHKRRLEEQLRQSQKIEAVGILAGGIAHDFNNILNAIMGFTYLARLKTPEDSAAAGYLNNLMEATNRAVDLVRQILTFSRKGAGELQPIIITPVVKEALKMLRATIPTTIEMRQHIVSAKYILGDPTHIHQIIMNLCTNAYHAMQDAGGVMEVRVEDIDVGPDLESLIADIKPGPHVRLTVSDTGQGIDPSVIDRIFDPYFTTKGVGKGTGLGLSVVYGIVKQCGGTVTVLSEPNNGSSFQVFFPTVHMESRSKSKTSEALMTGTETVLVVDDEESIVMTTGEILKGLGYNVVSTTNSEEALRMFREGPNRFDVVLTDMTMPKMTGIQLSKAILGIRPDVPIILSTGYSEGINEETVKKSGIRELLIKPVTPEKLSLAIRKVLAR